MNSQKKVLIAEDDLFISKTYAFRLGQEGFAIIMAKNGEEAVEKAIAENPDLILLDIIMPKKNGFEVLETLKTNKILKAIPIIILSNLGQETDIKKGMDLGAVDYIVKAHITIEEVVEKAKKYLQ
jgi:DNA-binding response OmpR family regulator